MGRLHMGSGKKYGFSVSFLSNSLLSWSLMLSWRWKSRVFSGNFCKRSQSRACLWHSAFLCISKSFSEHLFLHQSHFPRSLSQIFWSVCCLSHLSSLAPDSCIFAFKCIHTLHRRMLQPWEWSDGGGTKASKPHSYTSGSYQADQNAHLQLSESVRGPCGPL